MEAENWSNAVFRSTSCSKGAEHLTSDNGAEGVIKNELQILQQEEIQCSGRMRGWDVAGGPWLQLNCNAPHGSQQDGSNSQAKHAAEE